jgi:hypothetical protein
MDILTAEGVDVDGLWSRDERVCVARLCALITGDPSAAECS